MDWKSLSNRMFSHRPAKLRFQLPAIVLEDAPGFVAGARLDRPSRKIKRISVRELPPGSPLPDSHASHHERTAELQKTLAEVANELGGTGGAVGLLVPDSLVRVALLNFETLPDNGRESDALIRWRLKNLLPYPPEEARLSYEMFRNGSGAVEVMVMAARSSHLADYEAAVEGLSGQLTLLLPSTAALLPLLPSDEGGDLLIHASGDGLTTVIVAGQRIVLWRHEVAESEDAVRASAVGEAARAVASASDRLKVEIQRVWVCARPPAPEDLGTRIAAAISREVTPLSCPPHYASALLPEGKAQLGRFAMPFAGLVANGG